MARRSSQALPSRRLHDNTLDELRQLQALLPEICEREVAIAAPRQVVRSPLVLCRFRAQSAAEASKGCDAWDLTHDTVIGKEGSGCSNMLSRSDVTAFAFDHVFGPDAAQEEVYHHVEPIINEVMHGINCAVLCYGQTSAGKTYTMVGARDSSSCITWGIVPRTLASFFEASQCDDCQLRLSMLEIYMERLIDLLNPNGSSRLRILEDHAGKVKVQGLHEARVDNYMDALSTFWKGQQRRTTATTGMNDLSSRSHCIFILSVERSGHAASKLYLVDLAGSESIKKAAISGADHDFSTIAANMELSEESKAINQSLSTLGLVLNRLAERRKAGIGGSGLDKRRSATGVETHIPYRSSKLTRVLQDVFSGDARIALIINCSISSLQATETLSTLRFGRRARLLTSAVKPSTTAPLESAPLLSHTLRTARQEIQRLRRLTGLAGVSTTPPAKGSNSTAEDSEGQESRLAFTPIPHSAPPAPILRLPLLSTARQVPSRFDIESSTCWSDLTPREPDGLTPDVRPRRLQFFHGTDLPPSERRNSSALLTEAPLEVQTSMNDFSPEAPSPCWEYPMTRRESCMRAIFTQQQICTEAVSRLKVAEAELEWLQWLSPGETDLAEPMPQVDGASDDSPCRLTTSLAAIPDVTDCDSLEESCPEIVPEVSCAPETRAVTPELVPEVVPSDSWEDACIAKDCKDIGSEAVPAESETPPPKVDPCSTPRGVGMPPRQYWTAVSFLVVAAACAMRAVASWS
jgi:hypothetical protein